MIIVPQTVTAGQMAKAMRHFADAAARQFGGDLMNALTEQWDRNRLRIFLGAMEDALIAAERERNAEQTQAAKVSAHVQPGEDE